MTDEEFISLLDELGGKTAGWPEHQREGAMALLEHSARARASLKAMQDVECLLALFTPAPAFDIATLAARATRHGQASRSYHEPGAAQGVVRGVGRRGAGRRHPGRHDPAQRHRHCRFGADGAERRRRPMSGDRRWLVVGLVASLLVNLFLAGMLTGRFLFSPRPPVQAQAAAVMRRNAIRELPEEERLRFNVIMAAQGPALAQRPHQAQAIAPARAPSHRRAPL